MSDYLIKKTDIVRVYFYTSNHQAPKGQNPSEFSFDSATIMFLDEWQFKEESKRCNNRIRLKIKDELIDNFFIRMRYDMACQLLRRLHFKPLIDEVDSFITRKGKEIYFAKIYWKHEIDTSERCIDEECKRLFQDEKQYGDGPLF